MPKRKKVAVIESSSTDSPELRKPLIKKVQSKKWECNLLDIGPKTPVINTKLWIDGPVDDLIVHKQKIQQVRNWIQDSVKFNQKLLILQGKSGTGKFLVVLT